MYARDRRLVEIGKGFHVDVPLPGRPVKRMKGDADLVLKDGTLIETKFRSAPLVLDPDLNIQLIKYNRAVSQGTFTRTLLECNTKVSQAVKDRCSVLASLGKPIEIVEDLGART